MKDTRVLGVERLPMGQLLSVHVGMPRRMTTAQGRAWESAIVKAPVAGTVALGTENLEGDRQANQKYHGGPDKAVCVYCADHYAFWRQELGLELPYGAFGENFTVGGLTESSLCLGDVLSVGTAVLQISQPRQPCANLIRRWERAELPRRMEETGNTGFYLRTLRTGEVEARQPIHVVERPYPGWTLLHANRLMYGESPDAEKVAALRGLPALSAEWKRILGRKLRKSQGAA